MFFRPLLRTLMFPAVLWTVAPQEVPRKVSFVTQMHCKCCSCDKGNDSFRRVSWVYLSVQCWLMSFNVRLMSVERSGVCEVLRSTSGTWAVLCVSALPVPAAPATTSRTVPQHEMLHEPHWTPFNVSIKPFSLGLRSPTSISWASATFSQYTHSSMG